MSMSDTTSSTSLDRRSQPAPDSAEPKAPTAPKPLRKPRVRVWLLVLACLVAAGGAGAWYWWQQQLSALPPGIAKTNGRLEAEQAEIATKFPGRIALVLVKEGDMVKPGDVLARMDTAELEAQLQAAEALVRKAEHEKIQSEALIAQRISERTFAAQELQRTATLVEKGWSTRELLDQRQNQVKVAQAAMTPRSPALMRRRRRS